MKVGVVTIFALNNFGNSLQNYAVCAVLKKLGMQPETLAVGSGLYPSTFKHVLHRAKVHILCKANQDSEIQLERSYNFVEFSRKYLHPKLFNMPDGFDASIGEDYDYFLVGSDQVWNPDWYNKEREVNFLLQFAPDNKRISFAASFGVDDIPDKWKEIFASNLSRFKSISVREAAGKKIVEELTGKEVQTIIDPTMLLSVDDWNKIAKRPHKFQKNKPYILTYFLGGRTDTVERDIKNYAKANDLEVYNLLDRTQTEIYVSGPREFIYLISHAKLVMTDSFHACVFSFLFQKPFLVYSRQGKEGNMMSRIDTLLKTFSLERKYAGSGLHNELFEADYAKGYEQLETERKRAVDFLLLAIKK